MVAPFETKSVLTTITKDTNGDYVNIEGVDALNMALVIDANTPSAATFLAGVLAVDTYTLPAKAAATGGDHCIFYDTTGLPWAFALDKSGTDPVPSGAAYTAIAAANKVNVDISSATTATQVCDLVRTALTALTGYAATFTHSGTTTLINTNDLRGPITAAVPYNTDQSGAGSITVAVTTAGVASATDTTTDIITKTAHGLVQGLKVRFTTTGTLPAGIALTTDYFVIYLSSSTFAIATSLVLATAGTKVNITDQGVSGNTHTVTPTALAGATYSIEISPSVDSLTDGIWIAIGTPVSITADVNVILTKAQKDLILPAKAVRVAYVITAGSMTLTQYTHNRAILG